MSRSLLSRRVEPLEDRSVPAVAFALSSNSLIPFDTSNPAAALAPVAVSGLTAGDSLVGIDFRPQNNMLYGLGRNSGAGTVTLYAISPRTGAAAAVGAPVAGVVGSDFGFDFNPAVDRIRVVADSGQNFRLNPNTGALVAFDTPIGGAVTTLDGSAYTNNLPNTGVTSLYGLSAATDRLVLQSNPNGGVTTSAVAVTLNGAALDFTAANGFDIPVGVNAATNNTAATGAGFAALTVGGATRLYAVDLGSGAASDLGLIGAGGAVQGLAVWNDLAESGPAVNLLSDGLTLRRYAQQQPPTLVGITGVAAGETLSDIAWRPATGQLFGFGVNPGTGDGTLYLIDPQTGAATVVGAVGGVNPSSPLPPVSVGYGFSFNPTVDRIRVTTGTGLDFRINPNTGAVAANDPAINGGATGAVSASYTNSYNGTPVTTLYTLDAVGNTLSIQNPPNSGTQTATVPVTLNGAVLDFTEVNAFSIPPGVSVSASNAAAAGQGIAVLTVGGVSNFYNIDLTTGAATLLPAAVNPLPPLISLALGDDPPGAVGFNLPPGAGTRFVGGTTVTIPLTRTGGNVGAVTVSVQQVGGTAVAGVDFNGLPATVTFADGQTTATLTFTLPAGASAAGDKTLILGLANPTNGAVFSTGTSLSLTVAKRVAPTAPFAVGQDVGGGTVTVYNPDQTVKFGLPAFGVGYTLGVRTAMADVNGDGVADLIVGTGPGVASRVRVLDGVTQAELFSVQPFEGSFTGGVFVAGGDIDGDGKAEIVVTPDESGGPRVLIYNGGTFTQAASFFGIEDPNFRGGARAAVADINGDGFGDLIVAAGFGGGPRVAVFNGTTVLTALPAKLLPDFFAFEDTLRNGVYVGGGDVNGDGKADIITGGGPGGGPRVQIIDGAVALANGAVNVVPTANPPGLVLANFFAGDPNNRGGIRVTAKDLDGDLFADLVTGSGQGAGSQTTGYLGSALRVGTATPSFAFDAYPGFTGGVYVG